MATRWQRDRPIRQVARLETAPALTAPDQAKSPRVKGRFKKGQSGNPLGARLNPVAERARELFETMAGDFAALSAVDRTLLWQACLLLARSERIRRARDADAAIRMSGEARRLLASLQKRAKLRDNAPTLAEYLTSLEPESPLASDGTPQDKGPEAEALIGGAPKGNAGRSS